MRSSNNGCERCWQAPRGFLRFMSLRERWGINAISSGINFLNSVYRVQRDALSNGENDGRSVWLKYAKKSVARRLSFISKVSIQVRGEYVACWVIRTSCGRKKDTRHGACRLKNWAVQLIHSRDTIDFNKDLTIPHCLPLLINSMGIHCQIPVRASIIS